MSKKKDGQARGKYTLEFKREAVRLVKGWQGMLPFTMRTKLTSKLQRFLLVGLLNTAVGYGLFAILIWLDIPYPLAIGLATLCGIVFNFQSTGRLVFDNAPWSRMGRFAAVYTLVYGMNVGMVAVLLAWGINIYIANASVILPLALVAFTLQKKFVFAAP